MSDTELIRIHSQQESPDDWWRFYRQLMLDTQDILDGREPDKEAWRGERNV